MNYKDIVITLGNKCTAACDMCCLSSGPDCNDKIDSENIKKYILSTKDMPQIKYINFSGGEAFLYYDLLESLIKLCNEIGKKSSVITNAFWATEYEVAREKLMRLKEAGTSAVGVSYDEFHMEYVPVENIRNFIRAAKSLGLQTSIQAVLIKGSKNGSWMDELGKDLVDVIINFIPCDKSGNAKENVVDNDYIRNVSSNGCVCRKGGTYSVLYDGSVWPCCSPSVFETKLSVGNINEDIKDVNNTFKRLRNNTILYMLRNHGFDYFVDIAKNKLGMNVPNKVISSCELCSMFFGEENIHKFLPYVNCSIMKAKKSKNDNSLNGCKNEI